MKMPKPKPKSVKKMQNNKHNYQAWSSVLKAEQEKNMKRNEEVDKKYKAQLINTMNYKEKKY